MITINGLVIKENKIGESSKSIVVLCEDLGIINIFMRGGAKSKKNSSATQIFSYSKLCIDSKVKANGQSEYYLNSSEPKNIFYNIRLDPLKMSLACYFSELLCFSRIEDEHLGDVLKLTLNTLYFLNNDDINRELLKSIFEFRLLCEMGFRPYLVGCNKCFKYEDTIMHYNYKSGLLECDECCYNPDSIYDIQLDKALLYIVRYIALSDFNKLFSFKINDKYQKKLTEFTERFIKYNFKEHINTLDFYRGMEESNEYGYTLSDFGTT